MDKLRLVYCFCNSSKTTSLLIRSKIVLFTLGSTDVMSFSRFID